jgi:2-methylisocitrate lyase-like PEP mutase family enzyme
MLASVGCVFALHAGVARYAVVKALQDAFGALHQDSHTRSVRDRMASFEDYNHILGMDDWLQLERQFDKRDVS